MEGAYARTFIGGSFPFLAVVPILLEPYQTRTYQVGFRKFVEIETELANVVDPRFSSIRRLSWQLANTVNLAGLPNSGTAASLARPSA